MYCVCEGYDHTYVRLKVFYVCIFRPQIIYAYEHIPTFYINAKIEKADSIF